jgi:hypothetical protein
LLLALLLLALAGGWLFCREPTKQSAVAEKEPLPVKQKISVDDNGLTDAIKNEIPAPLMQAIRDLGMPINGGNTLSANIEGTFLISPNTLKASNFSDTASPGRVFTARLLTFSEQNNGAQTVKMSWKDRRSASDAGAYFVGDGNTFTVFAPMNGTASSGNAFKTVEIYSGTLTTEGIKGLRHVFIMVSGGGGGVERDRLLDNGQGRLIYDGDGLSEYVR